MRFFYVLCYRGCWSNYIQYRFIPTGIETLPNDNVLAKRRQTLPYILMLFTNNTIQATCHENDHETARGQNGRQGKQEIQLGRTLVAIREYSVFTYWYFFISLRLAGTLERRLLEMYLSGRWLYIIFSFCAPSVAASLVHLGICAQKGGCQSKVQIVLFHYALQW